MYELVVCCHCFVQHHLCNRFHRAVTSNPSAVQRINVVAYQRL